VRGHLYCATVSGTVNLSDVAFSTLFTVCTLVTKALDCASIYPVLLLMRVCSVCCYLSPNRDPTSPLLRDTVTKLTNAEALYRQQNAV
jgi:hypothetical protein